MSDSPSMRMQKLQQFFAKSNVYQNTSLQQIERQRLTISNESKIVRDISQVEEEVKAPMIRPYQTDFDKEMYLMAKPLIQPLLQLNIVSKPEINPKIHQVSTQLHRELEQAMRRSENILIEKRYASVRPGDAVGKVYNERFLNELRMQNRRPEKVNKTLPRSEPQTIKYESNSPQRRAEKEFDFKSINKKPLRDHVEQIRLPTKISEIYTIGVTPEDQQVDEETLIVQPHPQPYGSVGEKINFESIISIAGGQVEEYAISELVKNVQIAKRAKQMKSNKQSIEELDSSLEYPVDKQVSARPIVQDHSMQMSNKELRLPKVQDVLNGIRLAKNQYFMGANEDRPAFKEILKQHLADLLSILMVHYPAQPGINESINFLLGLKKQELAAPIDGVSRLELLYIFLSEYKVFQGLEQQSTKRLPTQQSTQRKQPTTTQKKKANNQKNPNTAITPNRRRKQPI